MLQTKKVKTFAIHPVIIDNAYKVLENIALFLIKNTWRNESSVCPKYILLILR